MGVDGGANPASGTVGAELHVQSVTVNYHRDPLPGTVNYHRDPLPGTVNYHREPLPETENYHREPPPAYTVSATAPAVTNQPTVQPSVILQTPLGNQPTLYKCPQCNERVITKIKHVASQRTHVVAGFTCGLFCWCMLCCLAAIPYMTTAFKTAEHYCPNCNIYLGKSTVSKW